MEENKKKNLIIKKVHENSYAVKENIEESRLAENAKLLLEKEQKDLLNLSNNQQPVGYGKNKILLFFNGEPLIVLGPHCI